LPLFPVCGIQKTTLPAGEDYFTNTQPKPNPYISIENGMSEWEAAAAAEALSCSDNCGTCCLVYAVELIVDILGTKTYLWEQEKARISE
jgi:hypothetical protein